MKTFRQLLSLSVAFASLVVSAEIEIPKASYKALGTTRGKPFSKGIVFVDGHYLEPPYVIERWGNGIRINKTPVIGQVVAWTEFLKTQDGVKISKGAAEPEAAADEAASDAKQETEEKAEPQPEPKTTAAADEAAGEVDTSLDDLFEDDPQPKDDAQPKKAEKKPVKKIVQKPKAPAPTTTYSLEGEFVPNDASRALVKKINKVRTNVNAILLSGGFICFGQKYARVSGGSRTAREILEKLPGIMRESGSESQLVSAVRSAGLVYLTEPICRDLYRNRRDYLRLQERQKQSRSDQELKSLVDDFSNKPRY